MRVFLTSSAALLALVAFGPGVTTVLGDDIGSSVGTPSVAGATAIRSGNEWVDYEPAVAAVPAVGYTSQPAYYQSSPTSYYTRPYGYTTGYRGYYGSAYQGGYYGPAYRGGSYYGSRGYYSQPGISIGVGFGRGFRSRW